MSAWLSEERAPYYGAAPTRREGGLRGEERQGRIRMTGAARTSVKLPRAHNERWRDPQGQVSRVVWTGCVLWCGDCDVSRVVREVKPYVNKKKNTKHAPR